MALRQKILSILSEYNSAQANNEASVRIKTAFQSIAEEINKISLFKKHRNIKSFSEFSAEYKSVAIPWIAFFDTEENTAKYREVYILLLFKADMTGVYLTVNQGGGIMLSAPISTLDFLDDIENGSLSLRKEFLQLLNSGFSLDRNIDLAHSGIIGKAHEKATVFYKYYDRNNLPSEDEIEMDISAVFDAYEDFVGNFSSEDMGLFEPDASKKNTLNKLLQVADVVEEDAVRVETAIHEAIEQMNETDLNNLITKIDERNRNQKVKKQNQQSEQNKRNPSLSWGLKQKYKDRCQVCQEKLVVENGFFCDTHHIVPLKKGGSDTSDNIAVVCPNHHRLLDRSNWQIISRDKRNITVKSKDQTVFIKLL